MLQCLTKKSIYLRAILWMTETFQHATILPQISQIALLNFSAPKAITVTGGAAKEGKTSHALQRWSSGEWITKKGACCTTTLQNPEYTCSAPRIVEEVMSKSADVNAPPASRPKPANLTRMANRVRLTMRPKDPKDLDFIVSFSWINSFWRTRSPTLRRLMSMHLDRDIC